MTYKTFLIRIRLRGSTEASQYQLFASILQHTSIDHSKTLVKNAGKPSNDKRTWVVATHLPSLPLTRFMLSNAPLNVHLEASASKPHGM
jgi:hypothetical protein